MSCVNTVKVEITEADMKYMAEAASKLGMVYDDTKKNFRRYYSDGTGDYANSPHEECVAVLSMKDNPKAYEVGVIRNKKTGAYSLSADMDRHLCGGLDALVGGDFGKLMLEFNTAKTVDKFKQNGFSFNGVKETGKNYVVVSMAKGGTFGGTSSGTSKLF